MSVGRKAALALTAAALAAAFLGGCGDDDEPGTTTSGTTATPTSSAALPNQGTKAAAPGVPTSKGGDNSVQTFGVESGSEDRVQAASAVAAYLQALASGRWAAACSRLSGPTQTQVPRVAEQLQNASFGGCVSAMRALGAEAPRAGLRRAARIEVLSMRRRGSKGFAIYRDRAGTLFELPLSREGGRWKITVLAGVPLGG